MRRKREWFENERFWRELYPYMFHPARFEQTAAEVRHLLRLVKRRHGAVLARIFHKPRGDAESGPDSVVFGSEARGGMLVEHFGNLFREKEYAVQPVSGENWG